VPVQQSITGTGAESIAANIEESISAGTLAPGDGLPPIRELAAQLGVNANTAAAAYRLLRDRGFKVVTSGGGPVFQLSFRENQATDYRETLGSDPAQYRDFVIALLDEGVLALPDGRWYISAAHSDQDIEFVLEAAAKVSAAAGV